MEFNSMLVVAGASQDGSRTSLTSQSKMAAVAAGKVDRQVSDC